MTMRKKCQWQVTVDMFGHSMQLLDGDKIIAVGSALSFNPCATMKHRLKKGFLFRNPRTTAAQIATIWDTAETFEQSWCAWVEVEHRDNQDPVYTAYVRCADASDATMFAFRHNDFEKWSDDKQKAQDTARKATNKLRVNKNGTIRATVTVETLDD